MRKTALARLLCWLTLVGAPCASGGHMDGTGAAGTSANAAGGSGRTDHGRGNGRNPTVQLAVNRATLFGLDG
ncbi:hypothetical protein C3E98_031155, partial [Pseudomonas sp. MWU13-2625]